MADSVSLKEFVESKINAIRESVDVAYAAMEKRLEGMNEFRDTLKDQAGRFATRDEVRALLEGINVDVRMLRESKAVLEGKASQSQLNIAFIISILGLLLGLTSIVIGFLK